MRRAVIGLACLTAPLVSAFAQEPSAAKTDSIIPMEQPLAGDHWTLETRDEISGTIKDKRVFTITDVTANEIAARYEVSGTDRTGFLVFDRDWNVKTADSMKYLPNSGLGIVTPLKVGTTKDFKVDQINTSNGFVWKWSGHTKVSGEEKVTTRAGTFDTLKIETAYKFYRTADPSQKSETELQAWYAPAIDHWVKRVTVSRTNNLVRVRETSELIEYGRKAEP